MTKRERVLASIQRTAFDVLPWQFDLTRVVAERLQSYYGVTDILEATDDHFVTSTYAQRQIPLAPGLCRNEFGAVWRTGARDINVGDWGDLVESPLKAPVLTGFDFPDGALPGRWSHIPALRQRYPEHFLMVHGSALFEQAWGLCGFENYLDYILSEETFVQALTERLADFSCAITAQLRGLSVDGIRFGDDWGCQDRLMIPPALWRRLFKPYYRRIYDAAHQAGLIVLIHSCGNITDILPDLIEIGVQVVHAFQPEAMDVVYCQREFGKDVTFWGGLGSQSTIPYGTPEAVRSEARRMLDLFHAGGYILAPAGSVPTETPIDNIIAIIDTARSQFDALPSRECPFR